MTLRTGLVITGDASGGQAALDALDRSAQSAETGINELGDAAANLSGRTGAAAAAVQDLAQKADAAGASGARWAAAYANVDAAIGKLAAVQAAVTQEINESKAAFAQGKISIEQFNEELLKSKSAAALFEAEYQDAMSGLRKANAEMANSGKQVVVSAGQQRAGFQQLSYQLGDVATMYSMGARPMQIFASQSGQVVQAIGLIRGEAGGLIGFLGGPWGVVIMGAVTVLASLAAAHSAAADASEGQKLSAEDLSDALIELRDRTIEQTRSTYASIQASLEDAIAKRNQAIETRKAAIAQLELAKAHREANLAQAGQFAGDGSGGTGARGGSALLATVNEGQITRLDAQIDKLNKGIDAGSENINRLKGQIVGLKLDETFDAAAAASGKFERRQDALNDQLASGKITLSQYATELYKAKATLQAEEDAARKSNRTRKDRKTALTEEQKALKQANEETKRFIDSLTDEIAKIGLNEKQLRQLEIQKAKDAAVTDLQRAKIEQLNLQREKALALQEAEKQKKANQEYEQGAIAALERELQTMELLGPVREKALLRLEREAEVNIVRAKLREAEIAGNLELIEQLEEQIRLIEKKYALESQKVDVQTRIDNNTEAQQRYNEQLRETIYNLEQIGGLGGPLAGLIGFLSGDYRSVGGNLGALLDAQIGTRTDDETGKEIAVKLGDKLKDVFGIDGDFAKGLGSVLQAAGFGAQVGTMADSLMGAIGLKSSKLGSQIGGAIGSAVAGPIGAVVGSVIGGLGLGAFKKTKKASATIGGDGDEFSIEVSGNSKSRKKASESAAGAVIDAVRDIAEQLGAGVDASLGSVSIGMRKKSWRVDTTGQGRTKKGAGVLDFGDDEQGALEAAVADIIADGVLTGLSESVQRLLKGGGDIQAQLQKALDMQGVFAWLEEQADPAGYALKQLGKEMTYLQSVFTEAGASAEEMARLQEYNEKKRAEIMAEAQREADRIAAEALEKLNDARSQEAEIMRLQGQATASLTLLREIELSQMDAEKRARQEEIYALQDAATIREMQIQLMEAEGREREAELARREEYLKTLTDAQKVYQLQIYAAQDAKKAQEAAAEAAAEAQLAYNDKLAAARNVLVQTYNREIGALQQTADKFRGLAQSLREFRTGLYGADSGLANSRYMMVELMKTGSLAARGDENAMGQLEGVGNDYLATLRRTAKTQQEYERGVALVANYADQAAKAAEGRVSGAQAQIKLLEKQVGALVDLTEGQITLAEAMANVKELLENPVVPEAPTPIALPEDYLTTTYDLQGKQIDALDSGFRANSDLLSRLIEKIDVLNGRVLAVAGHASTTASKISSWDRGSRCATVETA